MRGCGAAPHGFTVLFSIEMSGFMRFASPLGFLALLAVPAIVLMYLFKQKYEEKEISSLYLWKKAFPETKSEQPWQKLRKNLLMFLQIAAAVLLAASLAGPYIMGSTQVTDYVIALDCSMSMQAEDLGRSRFAAAKEAARDIVENAPAGSSFSLVPVTEEPYIALSASADAQAVLRRLETLQPTAGGADWQAAKTLLQAEKNTLGGEILLFTDDYGQMDGLSAAEMIFNGGGENAALTLLSCREQEDGLLALARVQNYGKESCERTVTLYADGAAFDTVTMELAAGEAQDVTFSGITTGTEALMARIFPEDALAADDILYQGVAGGAKQKALLVTEQNLFLEKALSVMGQIELYKTSPENAEALSGYALYIFDGPLPETLPENGFILQFSGGEGERHGFSGRARGVENAEVAGAENISFDISGGRAVSAAWGRSLLRADGETIAAFGERDGRKTAVFGFDLHDTDLPLTAGFPMLLHGLMEWYFPQNTADIAGGLAGGTLEMPILPETADAWIETPSGRHIELAPPFPPFSETDEPGIYRLVQADSGGNLTETAFGVNGRNGTESNLLPMGAETAHEAGKTKTVSVGRNIRNAALLLLLLVLAAEWRVNCRGD